MTEQDDRNEEGRLSGPGAGLGATGRTADQFKPGDAPAGGDYGDPAGIGAADAESGTAGETADEDDDAAGG